MCETWKVQSWKVFCISSNPFEITWVVLAFSYCHHNSLYLPLFHLGAKSWRVLIRDLVGWYFPCAQEQLLCDLPHLMLKNFAVCSLPFISSTFWHLLGLQTLWTWTLKLQVSLRCLNGLHDLEPAEVLQTGFLTLSLALISIIPLVKSIAKWSWIYLGASLNGCYQGWPGLNTT